ncbi:hypothetical protein CDAR_195521 [Caerostris darwini]|uniref:Uncharacterized protein n=1 Tax=Caerostris darwini TaxID=1538125 RepID=A0AAV4NEV9_9ARAC|nr:hypothetical protein CDAR_195521 [Caerostris darwini]
MFIISICSELNLRNIQVISSPKRELSSQAAATRVADGKARTATREREREPISDNGFRVTAMSIKVKPRSLWINKMLTFTGWEGRDKMCAEMYRGMLVFVIKVKCQSGTLLE